MTAEQAFQLSSIAKEHISIRENAAMQLHLNEIRSTVDRAIEQAISNGEFRTDSIIMGYNLFGSTAQAQEYHRLNGLGYGIGLVHFSDVITKETTWYITVFWGEDKLARAASITGVTA